MIVDPDFLDHWRTRMVVDALGGDEMAPIYVMRIWAHCQSRRASRFEKMPAVGLKALCRAPCDATQLEKALIDAEFITRDGDAIEVPKWAEANAKLIANWENGGKGGRPKQAEEEPKPNPNGTQTEPTDNPTKTQLNPSGNQSGTHVEPIRVEKSGEEKKEEESKAKASAAPKKSRTTTKTPLPNGFCISDRVMAWAIEKGYVHLDRHFENFIGKCKAKGYAYADWDEGFMGAIRDDWAKLNGQPRTSPDHPTLGKAGQVTAANAQKFLEASDADQR